MRRVDQELEALRDAELWRSLREVGKSRPPVLLLDGREVINFASNDYLGLSAHPALAAAAREAIDRFGTGSGASRLITGSLAPHHALENRLAECKKREAALTFSTGYATALGTLGALAGKGDTLILDKLCHACLIDGARLSGATVRVFPHNHLGKLERLAANATAQGSPDSRCLVVTESVFSMDGDRAPLGEIAAIAERHGALLLVDEAHALGVAGPHGFGVTEELGLEGRVDFQMGTLGKGLGSAGGYLAADRDWIDLLVNKARSFIYSTAPPPAQAAAALAGIEVMTSREGRQLRDTLHRNLETFADRLGIPIPESAIVPVVVGSNPAALSASQALLEAGFLVPAIRYPTVPRDTARLRITLSAVHTEAQVSALADCLQSLGIPAPAP